jgi:hypothetical protein
MSGCMAWAAQSGAGRLTFRCRAAVHRLFVALVRAPCMGCSERGVPLLTKELRWPSAPQEVPILKRTSAEMSRDA